MNAGPAGAALSIENLSVRYPNGALAVRGVSFEVAAGRTTALVGESGCGKTSIAHAIVGLLPLTTSIEGRIRLGETRLEELTERQRRELRGRAVGYVAQNPYGACDPLRSVGHHVASAWRVHGGRPPDGRVVELLGSLGIDNAAERARMRPHEWSGGMLQRASIAAAKARGPGLIVADEPTSALDADLARDVLGMLRSAGTSVLLITHDLSLAAEAADDVVVLYGGEVMEHGTAQQVLESPRHPYARALRAAIPRGRGRLPEPLPGVPPSPFEARSGCAFVARCSMATPECSVAPIPSVDGVACLVPLQ